MDLKTCFFHSFYSVVMLILPKFAGCMLLLCSEYKSKQVTKTDQNCVVVFMDAWTVVTVVKLCFFHTCLCPPVRFWPDPQKRKKKTHWKCNKNNLTSMF